MIDFHTHPVLIREFAEKYPDYTRMAREVFQIGNNLQPLETFFLQMDVAGIERAVLLPIACARARGLAVSSNEQVAELCGMSKRFIGFASVDPMQPGAAKELEAAIQTMGLKGLKLDAALQDFDLNDPKVFEVYEAAAALGIPALIHTGMSWAPGTPLAQGQPLLLEPAIRRFPRLNFVLAHWAWPWVWDANALALKYPNVLFGYLLLLLRWPNRVLPVPLSPADAHHAPGAEPAQSDRIWLQLPARGNQESGEGYQVVGADGSVFGKNPPHQCGKTAGN